MWEHKIYIRCMHQMLTKRLIYFDIFWPLLIDIFVFHYVLLLSCASMALQLRQTLSILTYVDHSYTNIY